MSNLSALQNNINSTLATLVTESVIAHDELTIEVPAQNLLAVCLLLRNSADFAFNQLIDLCAVDYLDYGLSEWNTENASNTGFERAVERKQKFAIQPWQKPRFAVIYHLLSLPHNHRIRIRTFVDEQLPLIESVDDIWPAASWFEREAFDLYGIIFNNHPDLRRILTDYGFIGHPFRKDFPLIGNVEMRYDAQQQRVVYEPVSIQPRILTPKIIRDDNRYIGEDNKNG